MTDVQESAVMVNHADAVAPDTSLPSLPPPPPSPLERLDDSHTVPLSAAPSNCPSPVLEMAEAALPPVAENNPFAQSWNCSGRMDELDKKCQTLESKYLTCVTESLRDFNATQSLQDKTKSLQDRIDALEICCQNDVQNRTAHEKKTCWATGLAVVGVLFGAVALVRSFWK